MFWYQLLDLLLLFLGFYKNYVTNFTKKNREILAIFQEKSPPIIFL